MSISIGLVCAFLVLVLVQRTLMVLNDCQDFARSSEILYISSYFVSSYCN